MMDITRRLKKAAAGTDTEGEDTRLKFEAADEIQRLHEENERLKEVSSKQIETIQRLRKANRRLKGKDDYE